MKLFKNTKDELFFILWLVGLGFAFGLVAFFARTLPLQIIGALCTTLGTVRLVLVLKRILAGEDNSPETETTPVEEQQIEEQQIDEHRETRAKSRFLERISHEIRTPITAVLGIAELQLQNSDLPLPQEEAFAQIFDSGNILLTIVNEILDLSSIEAGKIEINPNEYKITHLLADTVQPYLAKIESKDVKFLMVIDENVPVRLVGDAIRIRQILNHILSNAFMYSFVGYVELTVKYDAESKNLVFTVEDSGIGMTKKAAEALNAEYQRFKEKPHAFEMGLGLGLSIVYSLINLMDANIEIVSTVNKGTTVIITIPQEVNDPDVLGVAQARQLQNFEFGSRGTANRLNFTPTSMPYGKVLAVDDVQANLYVISGILKFYDITIETCDNPYDAINKIREGNSYDIIFMDQMMPGMNGTEAMLEIRKLGYTGIIVAFTANALIGQAEELIQAGFDGFISKPINTSHLDAILTRHIKDKQPKEVLEGVKENTTKPSSNDIAGYLEGDELLETLRRDFLKTQSNAYHNIVNALGAGDRDTARRQAHSLKGLAGLISEDALMVAARTLEHSIFGWGATPEELATLETELNKVLASITPKEEVAESTEPLDRAAATQLFDRIEPLLSSHNAEAFHMLDKLTKIPEAKPVVSHIENFDFDIALDVLRELRKELNC